MSHNLKTPINSKFIVLTINLGLIINNEILCSRLEKSSDNLALEIVKKDTDNLAMLNYQVCDILVTL